MIFINKINILHIVVFAYIIRLAAYFTMPELDFPDTGTYIKAGEELFATGKIGVDNVMPLHPIFVHILNNIIFIKLANILFSTLSVYLVYELSRVIFNNKTYAIVAALITCFYPYFIFYSITGLTESLYIFLLLSAFLSLYKKHFILASVIIVLSILQRPTLDLLAPILIFFFAYYVHKLDIKASIFNVLKYFVVYVIFMSPWWYHQVHKYDQFVRLNLGDGIVWFSGNNPENQSGGGVTGSVKGDDMNISLFASITNPIEKNNAMKKAAFEFIQENPQRFIELAGIKFIRFWRLWPYAPEYENPLYILISLASYGVILILSIIFSLQYMKVNFRRISPILLLLLYFTAVHMVLISSIRYRLPLEPFLIIFASVVLVNTIYKITNQKKRI
jgi:Gpi18-like mannosyltransferase